MPRRALGHLKNLGAYAEANTKKTRLSKLKKSASALAKKVFGKENSPQGSPSKPGNTKKGHKYNRLNDANDYDAFETRSHSSHAPDALNEVPIPHVSDMSVPCQDASNVEYDNVEAYENSVLDGIVFTEPEEIDNELNCTDAQSIHSSSESSASSEESDAPPGQSTASSYHRVPERRVGTAWEDRKPPTEIEALDALPEVESLLRPSYSKNKKQTRYKQSTLSNWSSNILRQIKALLHLYTSDKSELKGQWTKAADQASLANGKKSVSASRKLRERAKEFIRTRKIAISPYGSWTTSLIEEDEELAQELNLYLQSKGKYVQAHDILTFLDEPGNKEKYGLKKNIHLATAKRWMKKLGYRWVKTHKGLYFDGHEREDIVNYRNNVFLPTWYSYNNRMRSWDDDDVNIEEPLNLPDGVRPAVAWLHDESIYYAHDRRQSRWIKDDESPVPRAKGEGASIMDSEFVSAEYGYGRSPDGKETARVIFKPGKDRDGYFDNADILKQAKKFMDILDKYYPNDEHLLIYDNATTHTKRADDALSARKMPKFTPKEGTNWGIEVSAKGPNGKPILRPDGKPVKVKVKMTHGRFRDGRPQELYFPEGHPRAGIFKGMAVILAERGYTDAHKLRAECPKFKCQPDATHCCCRRILFNEPDFANVPSLLEDLCAQRGYRVIFLPKFHCELNFLEMVWGKSKRIYRCFPESSKEEDLEKNMIAALEQVTVQDMRKFSRRSRRFMEAYRRGLSAKEAAWANKRYRGHRMLPENLMINMDKVKK